MIVFVLMLAAAAQGQSAVDAERAFAADAQTLGQWSAFRKWSAEEAVMFVPQPVDSRKFLNDRKNPLKAVEWWPTASYVSCDGSLAVNTGGWRSPEGAVGFFSTVWKRQKNGSWRWIVDGGGDLTVARPKAAQPTVRRASCSVRAVAPTYPIARSASFDHGESEDKTLSWSWSVEGPSGDRTFAARLWTGDQTRATDEVIVDHVPASEPQRP